MRDMQSLPAIRPAFIFAVSDYNPIRLGSFGFKSQARGFDRRRRLRL